MTSSIGTTHHNHQQRRRKTDGGGNTYSYSLQAQSEVCKRVLTHLATGTTPTTVDIHKTFHDTFTKTAKSTSSKASKSSSSSSSSSSASASKSKSANSTSATSSSHANTTTTTTATTTTSIFDNNSTAQDEVSYNTKTDAQHHLSLTVALSILLDSTSPGPDPLALAELGWAYGGGGGGGMGDWDGCHYMPGSIGSTLRVLQDQVVVELINEYKNEEKEDMLLNVNSTSSIDYLSQKKSWWLQNHEVEYGKRGEYERSATRFCTIGGVPPWTVPYAREGLLWGPPIAGVCVPSSCTADGLYMLFDDEEIGFADFLLNEASKDGFGDNDDINSGNPDGIDPPTASRRFRYMSSLAQSFNAGHQSQMGIVCEGESGLDELDLENYHGGGYYATVALIWVLVSFVVLGTVSASCFLSSHAHGDDHSNSEAARKRGKKGNSSSERSEAERALEEEDKKHYTPGGPFECGRNGVDNRDSTLLMQHLPLNHNNYGTNDTAAKDKDKAVSFLDWNNRVEPPLDTNINGNSHTNTNTIIANGSSFEYKVGGIGEDSDESSGESSEDDPLLQSNKELRFINNEERRGIELRKSASFSLSERRRRRQHLGFFRYVSLLMEQLKSMFEYFNAGQSFYEITRMTREDPYVDSAHQQRLRKIGETSLDPSSSTPGLFPMYKALTPVRKGAIDPDYTVSVSSSKCLNGMRSISMLWIIFGHTLAVQSSVGYVNPAALLPPTGMMSSPLGNIVLSARYAVDTFFFIGGFLVMSGLLKKLDPAVRELPTQEEQQMVERWKGIWKRWGILSPKHLVIGEYVNRLKQEAAASSAASAGTRDAAKGLRWVIPFLLHRILRILPTYGFVLLLWWKIAVTLGDGPFWPRWATFVAQCDAHAWTNMLFVNNLVPRDQPFGETSECMYHAWYLGVDFQLCLVLAPIFLSLYLRKGWRMRAIILEVLTVIVIILASLHYSFKYHWSAHLWDGADTGAFDKGFYINPIFRSSPYIIGFITGQIWHEKCRLCPNLGLTRIYSVLVSLVSLSTMIYLTVFSAGVITRRPCMVWESPRYADCGSTWSETRLAIFNSLARPAWGFGLSLMSLLSFNGQLTFLWSSTILTWPGWDPISKLSFSMYLLHPLVINIWVLGGDDKFRFSFKSFFFAFAGIVVITFLSAIAIGVLVEWPISRITRDLEKKLWSSKNKDTSSKTDKKKIDKDCETKSDDESILLEVDNDYRHRINLTPSAEERLLAEKS